MTDLNRFNRQELEGRIAITLKTLNNAPSLTYEHGLELAAEIWRMNDEIKRRKTSQFFVGNTDGLGIGIGDQIISQEGCMGYVLQRLDRDSLLVEWVYLV